MNKCIVLIGFMGSGKSSVGRVLADNLEWDFIDTDTEIEKQLGLSISDIITKNGEMYFREVEKQYVQSIRLNNRAVISCGGGTVIDESNSKYIKSLGTVIYLRTGFDSVISRVGNSNNRPLLEKDSADYPHNIKLLLDKREEYYFKICDFIIDTDDCSVVEVANNIKKLLKY